jgi:transposase
MRDQLSNRSKDWREGRRFRAWELREKGWTQQRIAEALGVTKGAVSQWLKKAAAGGVETLRHRKRSGAPSRLTSSQKSELPELLSKGAESHGFRGELWTCKRVAAVIRGHYGVSYHPSHVSRILRSLEWSLQKPKRRAKQRKEDEIREWLEEKWPEIRKKGKQRIAQ